MLAFIRIKIFITAMVVYPTIASTLSEYEVYPGKSLYTTDPYTIEAYTDVSDETCAFKCTERSYRDNACKSFLYNPLNRTCQLSKLNSLQGVIFSSPDYDYYELSMPGRGTKQPPIITQPSASMSVTLVGGSDEHEGNVELTIGQQKYRVCDDSWTESEANVICNMLGYSDGGTPTENSHFGKDDVPILLDDVKCVGDESDLGDCDALVGVDKTDCNYKEFAGVICNVKDTELERAPTSLATGTPGRCGVRPYDNTDLFSLIRRRRNVLSRRGYQNIEHKVVGGRFAQHGELPWQVRIHRLLSILESGEHHGVHHCGGVIINEYWILSAAHCFYDKRKSHFRLIVGDHHKTQEDKGEQEFTAEKLILRPDYNDTTKHNDFALIKVKSKNGKGIQFNHYVQPVCLPTSETPHTEHLPCLIAGWGNTQNSNELYPHTLKSADVPIIDQAKCKNMMDQVFPGNYRAENMVCAGYAKGGIDTCDGDSGGPLVCNIEGAYTLLGITSWGKGCAESNQPGVYSKVIYALSWINKTIRAHS